MRTLERITIENFKSIREQQLQLGRLNVFIGGNGTGKSNLIQAFKFLREIVNQRLGNYTQVKGGADNLLYFGRKRSPEMRFYLEFGEGDRSNAYEVVLAATDVGGLFVKREVAF